MDFLKPPKAFLEAIPEGPLRDAMASWGWYVILAIGAFLLFLIVWSVIRAVSAKESKPVKTPALEEDLETYPAPPPRTGDRRLLVEGVPVRIRLVVVAPAGSAAEERLDLDRLDKVLERVVPGMGAVFKEDKPRVKGWSRQVSYQGFAAQFFHSVKVPEEEGELTPWVLVAGRVKLKEFQMMLGFALLALKPTTVGQRTLDAHQWESVLRVRMRD